MRQPAWQWLEAHCQHVCSKVVVVHDGPENGKDVLPPLLLPDPPPLDEPPVTVLPEHSLAQVPDEHVPTLSTQLSQAEEVCVVPHCC